MTGALAVTIVIPNYNGAHLLERNLPSVFACIQADGLPAEVIVVDDGSGDRSLQVLREQFPQVRLIVHAENRGFAEAIWTGVQAAGTPLLFLLNSDVELKPGCLARLLHYFDLPDTFAVNPLILEEDGTVNRHSYNRRDFRNGNLKAIPWEIEHAIAWRRERRLPVLYTSGGSMMVRRTMFVALGGFHPIFKPFYGEDYDLGLRAWRHGWRCYFEPGVSAIHQSRGSIKDHVKRDYVKQIRRRNKYLLEWIHFPLARLWLTVIPLSLWQLLGELLLLDKVNLKGFAGALCRLPDALAARHELNKQARLGFSEILRQTRI